MLKSYLLVAIRNLLRNKLYSGINIAGLAIGMTCCMLILLYIRYELNYDAFHANADHLYRVIRETRTENIDPIFHPGTSGPMGPALETDIPEILGVVRTQFEPETWVSYGDRGFVQDFLMADASILDVFSFPLIKGDPKTVLEKPYSVVLTREMAEKYFGNEDPIGKILEVNNKHVAGDFRITGVVDHPPNTQIRFDFLSSTRDPELTKNIWLFWQPNSTWRPIETFVRLDARYTPQDLETKLSDFMARYMGEDVRALNTYHLQPIKRIHLYAGEDYGMVSDGDITYVYLFLAIAGFILIIACINFMNMATARSAHRAREVGMRKVVGASRKSLILQFVGEAILLSLTASLLAVVLTELCLPSFNEFLGIRLELDLLHNNSALAGFLILVFCVGILSGSYPALFLSRFQPVNILKGIPKSELGGVWMRKCLVIFQFAISIGLIVGTLVIHNQRAFIQSKHLGFNKEQLVAMPLFFRHEELNDRFKAIKRGFLRHPNVLSATASLRSIDEHHRFRIIQAEGVLEEAWMHSFSTDEDFIDTFEINLIQGRGHSKDIATNTSGFILNETAVKQLGWDDPIGKQFEYMDFELRGPVIGVAKDFHFGSLHTAVGPAFLCNLPGNYNWLTVRIRAENIPETLTFLESEWNRAVPHRPFEYDFLDNRLDKLYRTEKRLGQMFYAFALLAILIACLGIFAMAAFTTEQRTKEIGVRKVLGATSSQVVGILVREFTVLVLLANFLAWPVAYYAINGWLQGFPYRISLGVTPFGVSGLLALLIALSTVGYQAFRAATSNPVKALRYE